MSRPIFLSYRHADSAAATGRLNDAIGRRFGTEAVYMDRAATAWGEEWPSALENAISSAHIVIVVMGPNWIRDDDEFGRRLIDKPDDWVRREIELALSSRKMILPLLVDSADMPPREAFPPEIADITERHAISMRLDTWDEEIDGVLDRLSPLVAERAEGTVQEEPLPVADRFRAVASRFYDSPMRDRMAAAEEIAGIGGLLELDEVLDFAHSTNPAERVGAAVAIAAHLRTSERLRDDPRVRSAVRKLLGDGRSRVRYRAADVLRGFPALVPAYETELTELAELDSNEYVRRMARRALARAGGGA
jgi:hypothetical protein